jgi:hypothetical protein
MSNDFGFGENIANMFKLIFVLLIISIFGIWKIVEIIIWLIKHVRVI